MSKYVISTLTADNRYTGWVKSSGINMAERSVLVRGGAAIATPGGGRNIVTPQGVRTEVSDSDAEFLAQHEHFKNHMKGGFVRIESRAIDPDKAAKSMDKDSSQPKTEADVKADGKKDEAVDGSPPLQVTTNKK